MARWNAQLYVGVAAYRKATGLTQQRFARLAGVSRQTIVELEKGDYNPSVVLAMRVAVLLDAIVEELFALPGAEGETLRGRRAEAPQQKGARSDEGPRVVAELERDHRHRTR